MSVQLLDAREAATTLRISVRHLLALVARGELAVVHAGRRRLFSPDALRRFVEEHEHRVASRRRPTEMAAEG
jgi:excisionase family DNA binding protein